MAKSGLLFLAIAAAGLLAGPVAADLLVTRDGGTITTLGEWEVRGKVVHFTGLDGRLRSLRLVDLDLEESERRTRAAAESRRQRASERAEEAAVPAAKKAVLVLTDADVRHVRRSPAGQAAGEQEAEASADAGGEAEERPVLRVSDWAEDVGADGLEITGTLQNDSDGVVAGVSLTVDLLGEDGEVTESAAARLDRRSLAAGESSRFRASFRSFFTVRDPVFHPRGSLLAPARPQEEALDDASPDLP